MLPDALFAIDGMLDTFLTILNQMEVFLPSSVRKEKPHLFCAYHSYDEAVKAGRGENARSYQGTCVGNSKRSALKGKISKMILCKDFPKTKGLV